MTITPERLANPQKLLKLAKVMGLRRPFITELGDYDECLYCTEDDYIIFRPHLDKAQAMEVLEWVCMKDPDQVHLMIDQLYCDGKLKVDACFRRIMTMPEAITLAALKLIES